LNFSVLERFFVPHLPPQRLSALSGFLFQINFNRVIILYVCSQKLLFWAEIDCEPKIIARNPQLADDFCAFESLTKKGSCDSNRSGGAPQAHPLNGYLKSKISNLKSKID
jgi:hypothetical protein